VARFKEERMSSQTQNVTATYGPPHQEGGIGSIR